MNALVLDVWHDLQQKRLWPVAAVLALALIAVPVLLLKGSTPTEAASPAGGSGSAAAAPGGPRLALEDAADRTSSKLDVFSVSDPFKRPVARAPQIAGGQGLASSGGVSEFGGGLGEPSLGSASSDPFSSLGGASLGGGGSAGGSPESSAPSASSPSGGSPTSDQPTLFNYQVDVRFGADQQERTRTNLPRFTPLPTDVNPYVLYLGVTESGKSAVFMVDTDKVTPRGEGQCKPSPQKCTFLYLRDSDAQDQHSFFDQDGKRYNLRLIDLELVPVETGEKVSTNPADQQPDAGGGTPSPQEQAEALARSEEERQAEQERSDGSEAKGSRVRASRARRDVTVFPLLFELFGGR